jgi:hypothetical protein
MSFSGAKNYGSIIYETMEAVLPMRGEVWRKSGASFDAYSKYFLGESRVGS